MLNRPASRRRPPRPESKGLKAPRHGLREATASGPWERRHPPRHPHPDRMPPGRRVARHRPKRRPPVRRRLCRALLWPLHPCRSRATLGAAAMVASAAASAVARAVTLGAGLLGAAPHEAPQDAAREQELGTGPAGTESENLEGEGRGPKEGDAA